MKKKLDALGRIGIPKNMREGLSLKKDDLLELSFDAKRKQIILKKAENVCCACGNQKDLLPLQNDTFLCSDCLKTLNQAKTV